MVRGALSDVHLIQIKVVTVTLNAQKYQDEILESGVRPPLDSLDGRNKVLQDDVARPHFVGLKPYGTCVRQARLTSWKPGTSRIKML